MRLETSIFLVVGTMSIASCSSRNINSSWRQEVRNDEFSVSASFPASDTVCESQSGGSPRGFYVIYDGAVGACDLDPHRDKSYGIYASFNSTDLDAPEDLFPYPCMDLTSIETLRSQVSNLRIKNTSSSLCVSRPPTGGYSISIAAQAGRWPNVGLDGSYPPHRNYVASLTTPGIPTTEDVLLFSIFVRSVIISG